MGYQPYPVPGAVPAEASTIKTLLHVIRILAIIFGILLALGGIAYVALVAVAAAACNAVVNVCPGLGFLLIWPIFLIIFGVVDVVIYLQMKEIESLVDQRQYDAAKSKTLIWMILGFILGGIILGILLLVAYLKFDPLINWQRSGGASPPMAPGYGAPTPYGAPPAAAPPMAAPPPAAAPPMAPAPVAAAPTTPCPRCGRPATWIAQYNRWYCTSEQQYL